MSEANIPYVIGMTGGVGAGKSTVLALLQDKYGAGVIQADLVAKELMEPGGSTYEPLLALGGSGLAGSDGRIDKAAMAAWMFGRPERVAEVNAIVHPLVYEEIRRRIRESDRALLIYESALPREARLRELCREVWYIYAPIETRVERLMKSRGYAREKCLAIMENQIPDEVYRSLSDTVIDNGGDERQTLAAVEARMQRIREELRI